MVDGFPVTGFEVDFDGLGIGSVPFGGQSDRRALHPQRASGRAFTGFEFGDDFGSGRQFHVVTLY
jgi:hypothetical protein